MVFFGLKSALRRSTRSSGTRATPACISARSPSKREVATLGAGEQVEQGGLAAAGQSDESNLHGRPLCHPPSACTGDPLTVELLVASLAVAVGIGLTTR